MKKETDNTKERTSIIPNSDFYLFLLHLFFDFNYLELFMRNHLEHPYFPHHPSFIQPFHNSYPIQKIIFARPYHSPSSFSSNPPLRQQRKLSFTHDSSSQLPFSAYNPNAPAFRQLRQRYINQPTTVTIQQHQSQTFIVQEPEKRFERISVQKKEEVKLDSPRITLASVTETEPKKKSNVSQNSSAEEKNQKMKSAVLKMEAIIQQLPYLQESKALFSQMNYFKRRMNELQDQNNKLKAELFTQQVKNTTDLENHQKQEEKLIQEVKSLKIELQKNSNEVMMAKISQAETQKKCKKLMLKYRSQQKEIMRLKEQVGQKYSERDSTTKSQTEYYPLP